MTVTLERLGEDLRAVGLNEYRHAQIIPRLNARGTFTATLDPDKAVGLHRGGVVLWRDEVGTVLPGIITSRRRIDDPTGPEGDRVVAIRGKGLADYLAGRLAYPDPTLEADHEDQPATWDQTGPAGEVLADMVRLNAGPGALSARQVAGLEVPDATGVGLTVRARRRFPVVSDEVKRLGEAGGVACELTRPADEAVLRFLVREVEDLSAEVFFSPGRGNLYGFDAEELVPDATVAIVAGRGEGADRKIRIRERAVATWGRREIWVDARQVGDDEDSDAVHAADLDDEGDATLAELRAREDVAADVVDLPDSPVRWRRDYRIGDVVGVTVDQDAYAAQVTEVLVDASGETGTTYTPTVGRLSPRRKLTLFERLAAAESRLAAQERS